MIGYLVGPLAQFVITEICNLVHVQQHICVAPACLVHEIAEHFFNIATYQVVQNNQIFKISNNLTEIISSFNYYEMAWSSTGAIILTLATNRHIPSNGLLHLSTEIGIGMIGSYYGSIAYSLYHEVMDQENSDMQWNFGINSNMEYLYWYNITPIVDHHPLQQELDL